MQKLIELITNEHQLYLELNELLQSEQQVLIAQNIEQIQEKAQQKLQILEKIKTATNLRIQHMKTELNIQTDNSFSFANWLLQNNNDALRKWLKLEALVIETKATNDINAELVQRYLNETSQALDILKQAAPDLTQSYNKKGNSSYSNTTQHKYKA